MQLTNRLKTDNKIRYELTFIVCLIAYEIFTLADLIIKGKEAIQWEILYHGQDVIADFTNVIGYSAAGNPYNHTVVGGYHEKSYPPLQYVISQLLSRNIDDIQPYYDRREFVSMYQDPKVMMMYVFLTVITVIGIYECMRFFKNGEGFIKTLSAIAVTLSFPVLLTIQRGNSILAVALLVMIFIIFYDSDNKVLREISYIALALAAAVKMTPAIFGVILIIDKRWKDAGRTVIYGLAAFFLPFLCLKDGFANIPVWIRNMSLLFEAYKGLAGCNIMGFVINYFAGYSYPLYLACTIITVIICAVCIVAAFVTSKRADKILYLCLITVILPSHSPTYCLLYLIPAFIALLNEDNKRQLDKFLLAGGILCMCEFGGIAGIIFNHYIGMMLIIIVTFVRALETIAKKLGMIH